METLITSNLTEIAAGGAVALAGAVLLSLWAAIRAHAAATPADWDDRIVRVVETIVRAVISARAARAPEGGPGAAADADRTGGTASGAAGGITPKKES